MFPVLQLFLLIFTTLLFHIGITTPNVVSAGDYIPYEDIASTFTLSFGPKLGKFIIWSSAVYQMLYLYSRVISPASISTLVPEALPFINPLALTPISVLGYVFMIIGGLGRLWCYRTLGSFFTFKLTIRNSHKLIKTGPYAYVRHPSYTFACILVIGMFLVHRRLANFLPNQTWIQILFGPAGFFMCCTIPILFITRRVIREEQELTKKFGKEWIEYASKTKGFIPRLI